MSLKTFFIITITSFFCSCTPLYMKLLIKTPKVESQQSISAFLVEHNFDTLNSYYMGDDINMTNRILKEHLSIVVFDSAGNQLYNLHFTCPYNNITAMGSGHPDSALMVKPDGHNLFRLIKNAKELNGTPFDRSKLSHQKYYVVVFWQKFMGAARGYRQTVEEVEKDLSSRKDISVLKINSDIMISPANAPKPKYRVKLVKENENTFFKID